MKKYKKQILLLVLALLFTFSSLAFGRLGEPYRCTYPPQYMESYRDERGIPFIFVKRSVQGTSCSPEHADKQRFTVREQGNSIRYGYLIANIIFWFSIMAILNFAFNKSTKK